MMSSEYQVVSIETLKGGSGEYSPLIRGDKGGYKNPLWRGEKCSAKGAAGLHKRGVCSLTDRGETHPCSRVIRDWTLNCLSPLKRGFTVAIALILVIFMSPLTSTVQAQGSESSLNTPLNLSPEGSGQALLGETYPQLEEYLRIASEENPELRALWYQYRAELEIIPQVGTLPDPEINIGYTFNPMFSDPFLGRFSVSAMQMFPWFGTLQTRRDMQQASAEAGHERLNSRQLDLYRDIQTTWFDLAELHRKIEIAKKTIELVRDLESSVEIRYETARAGQADLLRIQMEEQRLKTLIENLADKINPVRAAFNAFLNRPPESDVETPGHIRSRDLYFNEDELISRIRELNPQFNELDARREMLQEQRNLARLDGRPSFGIGVEVMGRDFGAMSMFPDSREMVSAMATIRIPIFRSRYSAQYRQATEQLRSLDYQEMQTDNKLITELEQALEQHRESVRSATLLEQELIPRAEQALEILSEEYAAGNVSFDEVLRLQEQLLELELEHIEVMVKQNKAVIRIETLIGDVAPYYKSDK